MVDRSSLDVQLEIEVSNSECCFARSILIFMISPTFRPALRRSSSLALRRISKSSICMLKSMTSGYKWVSEYASTGLFVGGVLLGQSYI